MDNDNKYSGEVKRPPRPENPESALNTQVGGGHYREFNIQPIEFIQANGLGFIEGNVIKYVCRHGRKNGVQDLDKAIHYLRLLKQLQYGVD